ncbi:hypothetical protein ZIOFF_044550 [Zingiber officinale]|uniref:Ysc84 actin-binding domain-containing protein n=1 Tax=Zingiber officinale TaxID=94328 RepID=A0A8J5FXD6_ZINOF|nr:hypothetical protein ZIOFF_044550 [Zingiber officinale]
MYLKLGRVPAARVVFDAMACRNVMSFNILIGGLIHNGDINAARKLFDEMPERNLATWNAMIAGLAHFELDEEGLECFLRSRREGLRPDEFGLGSTLRCCARLKDAGSGRQIHAFVVINGFEQDMCVGSSLAHMYMRSGHLEEGERVLRGLPFLNVVSFHTVIAGRAQNGDPEGAFHHFILMKNVGLLPDHVTFIGGELMDYIIVLHGSKAVKTFCSRMHFSLGAGLSAAAGPIGRVLKADPRAGDKGSGMCYTYSCSKGRAMREPPPNSNVNRNVALMLLDNCFIKQFTLEREQQKCFGVTDQLVQSVHELHVQAVHQLLASTREEHLLIGLLLQGEQLQHVNSNGGSFSLNVVVWVAPPRGTATHQLERER